MRGSNLIILITHFHDLYNMLSLPSGGGTVMDYETKYKIGKGLTIAIGIVYIIAVIGYLDPAYPCIHPTVFLRHIRSLPI